MLTRSKIATSTALVVENSTTHARCAAAADLMMQQSVMVMTLKNLEQSTQRLQQAAKAVQLAFLPLALWEADHTYTMHQTA